MATQVTVHKRAEPGIAPKISIILLDWSVRESFHALDWLTKQNVPREEYELIWVELYHRAIPEVMVKADTIITCGQKGVYHKHIGYNAGLLHSRGLVVTICDSDAVYPPDFIASIVSSFQLSGSNDPIPVVLMHHERRTLEQCPEQLSDIKDLHKHHWLKLWPNVGACMSVRREDAIRLGGFDEHSTFRGYFCGPYDLGWRLVNAGIPEIWHDESVTLWHFAHPEPTGSRYQFSVRRWREITFPHIDYHALTAVEAFSTGRLLPLKENPGVHELRMMERRIGLDAEKQYAWLTGPAGFTKLQRWKLRASLVREQLTRMYFTLVVKRYLRVKSFLGKHLKQVAKKWLNPAAYETAAALWHSLRR